jgi:hypothetical protein
MFNPHSKYHTLWKKQENLMQKRAGGPIPVKAGVVIYKLMYDILAKSPLGLSYSFLLVLFQFGWEFKNELTCHLRR